MKRCLWILVLLLVASYMLAQEVHSKNALVHYVNNGDTSYHWEVNDTLRGDTWTGYRLNFISQTWRNSKWIHELLVIIPDRLTHKEALLHVAGGSVDVETNQPNLHKWTDGIVNIQAGIAVRCEAVTAVLWQVPRQPLYGGKYEDELVSYTFHQFQQDKDYTWPLLFPMVKSAVKAMDAVEEFTWNTRKKEVNRFVINGISKRGWTTWMTAATGDKRIVAIAPMVIDILNMPVSIPYQRHMYGSYSVHIQDYVNLGLTEDLVTPVGRELVDMIDPYSYRKMYTMPKMVVLGSNDEFWTADAVKNYIDGIPGEKYISYITNAGHGLGPDAFTTLEAFFFQTIHGKKYPKVDYQIRKATEKVFLDFKADRDLLADVVIWEAGSENKDFRKSEFKPAAQGISKQGKFTVEVNYPTHGYKAFLVMLKYKHPSKENTVYHVTTRMYTAAPGELFDEAYVP